MVPGRPTLRYAAPWLAAGTAIIALVLWLGGGGREEVSLPPVRGTDLASAVRASGCSLRTARRGEALNPPVDGPFTRPPRPAAYDRPLGSAALVAALRRGVVVLQYRPQLPGEVIDELRVVQRGLPNATVLAPNGTRMPFDVAVAAHRRLLGCPRYGPRALDAIRLFRGRYVGRRATD